MDKPKYCRHVIINGHDVCPNLKQKCQPSCMPNCNPNSENHKRVKAFAAKGGAFPDMLL